GAPTRRRNGFFLIRGQEDHGLSERILAALPSTMLLDQTGAGDTYTLHALGAAESANQGTLKQAALEHGARYAYTLEAPTRLAAPLQVRGLLRMLYSSLHNLRAHGELGTSTAGSTTNL